MAHNVRSNAYMVTCFDLEAFEVPDTHNNFKYMVYQVEVAPTTGAWHFQCYMELHRVARLTAVNSMFPCEVHLEPRIGTREQARAYCMKEDTRLTGTIPSEYGVWTPSKQGQRTDLVEAAKIIQNSTSWANVVNNPDLFPVMARHSKWVEQIYANRQQEFPEPEIELRNWQNRAMAVLNEEPKKRRIIWIWSVASGTGKTTFYDYVCSKKNVLAGAKWLDTIYLYDGHEVVWFDRTRAESNSEKETDTFYSDLEKWSNGGFQTSTKYVPVRKFVKCHVVVTANCGPDKLRLPDRFLEIPAKTQAEEDFDAAQMSDDDDTMDVDTEEKPSSVGA